MATTELKAVEELRWIEETEPFMGPPPIEDISMQGISVKDRLIKKTTDNLFVPLGLIATTACLAMGLVNMTKGDSKRQQFYMRGRIFCQGFTLVAMTMGLWWTNKKREKRQQTALNHVSNEH